MSARPLVPLDGGTPDWPRRVANAVNRLTNQPVVTSFNGASGDITYAGGGGSTAGAEVTIVSSATLAAGTPVTVSRSTGQIVKSDAASKPTSFVVGLLKTAVTATFAGTVSTNELILADWTAVTGTASLSPGQLYFLAAGGGLTTTPPLSPNNLAQVGEAANTTTLIIAPQTPIQL